MFSTVLLPHQTPEIQQSWEFWNSLSRIKNVSSCPSKCVKQHKTAVSCSKGSIWGGWSRCQNWLYVVIPLNCTLTTQAGRPFRIVWAVTVPEHSANYSPGPLPAEPNFFTPPTSFLARFSLESPCNDFLQIRRSETQNSGEGIHISNAKYVEWLFMQDVLCYHSCTSTHRVHLLVTDLSRWCSFTQDCKFINVTFWCVLSFTYSLMLHIGMLAVHMLHFGILPFLLLSPSGSFCFTQRLMTLAPSQINEHNIVHTNMCTMYIHTCILLSLCHCLCATVSSCYCPWTLQRDKWLLPPSQINGRAFYIHTYIIVIVSLSLLVQLHCNCDVSFDFTKRWMTLPLRQINVHKLYTHK